MVRASFYVTNCTIKVGQVRCYSLWERLFKCTHYYFRYVKRMWSFFLSLLFIWISAWVSWFCLTSTSNGHRYMAEILLIQRKTQNNQSINQFFDLKIKNRLQVLAHLSWILKWAFLITCRPASVRLLTFHIFDFFSITTGPTSTEFDTKYPWVKGIQICSNKGLHPFQWEIITK